jgi:hypothetical protein
VAYFYVKATSGWPTAPTATQADPKGANSGHLWPLQVRRPFQAPGVPTTMRDPPISTRLEFGIAPVV